LSGKLKIPNVFMLKNAIYANALEKDDIENEWLGLLNRLTTNNPKKPLNLPVKVCSILTL